MGALIVIAGAGSAGFYVMKFANKLANISNGVGGKYESLAHLLFILILSALATTFVAMVTAYFPERQEILGTGSLASIEAIAVQLRSMQKDFMYLALSLWISILVFILWVRWHLRELNARSEAGK